MSNLIQSIIFAVFGIVIVVVGIFTKSDISVIVIGALFAIVAIIFAIIDFLEKKKADKREENTKQVLKG